MITQYMQLQSVRDADVWADQLGLDPADTVRAAQWIWEVKPALGCTYAEHPLSHITDDEFYAAIGLAEELDEAAVVRVHASRRIYRIEYQLGAMGSEHRTIPAAVRALEVARRAARRGGDQQAITIRAYAVHPASYGRDLEPIADAALASALGL